MKETKKRDLLPDVLRGFAICLVVFAHCIQEGSGESFRAEAAYFDDRLYQLIYSFHMPLFMLVSGWLGWYGMRADLTRREQWQLLAKRAKKLLFPIFAWTALDFLRQFCSNAYQGYPHAAFGEGLLRYAVAALENLWFLWAVFWCFFIVWLMHYWFRDNKWLYAAGFLLMFFIPDGLGLGAYKYMLPYYVIAYYAHEIQQKTKPADSLLWLIAAGAAWLLLFVLFFDRTSFIYLTGYKLIGKDAFSQLMTDIYRLLVGLFGSAFFILLWSRLLHSCRGYTFPVLARLGQNSMGIYILSGYLLVLIVAPATKSLTPDYAVNLAEMLLVLAVSLLLSEVLGRIPAICRLVGK